MNNIHEEKQYFDLIKNIREKGTKEKGRNGNTLSYFGNMMRFSLEKNKIPLMTTKKLAWKTCFKELMFFIRGETNNILLREKKVNIWNANGNREFLDSRGLHDRKEDDLGPIYGFQWRHWNAEYSDCEQDYSNKGIDQLKQIIETLKNPETRTSRRMILTAWNPQQLDSMALPPCHVMAQFHVSNGNCLHCALFQRSGDVALGVPFNIASYSFLTHLIAHHCGLIAHEFVYFLGNAHIYEQHEDDMCKQMLREPYEFPTIDFKCEPKEIENYQLDDFDVKHYKHHENIVMSMVA